MKDRLDEFVHKHRSEFDDEVPSPKVWRRISSQLPAARSNPFIRVWQVAAVLFFATTVYLLVDRIQTPIPDKLAAGESFSQVEDFYFQEINQKRALIQDMSETGVSAEAELQKLDAMYLILKDQFREDPSKEVIEALTLNLIVRLDLLNQVVADIESTEEVNSEPPRAEAEI